MLFNSYPFLIFLAIFFLAWPLFRESRQWRWFYLCVASFVFYGWWDWRFLFLLLASGLIDFFAALAMERFPSHRKLLLVSSMAGNLGILGLFKYSNFFMSNLKLGLEAAGFSGAAGTIPIINLTLPVGVSFYTFQSMSYTIDVYRKNMSATKNVLHFFAYLSMFPQLVAGPIVRASDLLPHLRGWNAPSAEMKWDGLKLMAYGYFKKVVIADNLAPVISGAFGGDQLVHSGLYWWVIVSMFAVQIYCDFSGYSDIARGLAKWMGYEFPLNFNHPYTATSIRDFWARWHISLSTWFRDYVYISLGGSRVGEMKGYRNMWVAMLLSGLWHGANWTFVIWAALHAFYLSFERLTSWPRRMAEALPFWGRIGVTALVMIEVLIAWVFFRAQSIGQALEITSLMLNPFSLGVTALYEIPTRAILFLIFVIAWEGHYLLPVVDDKIGNFNRLLKLEPVWVAAVLMLCVYMRGPGNAFIYFQF